MPLALVILLSLLLGVVFASLSGRGEDPEAQVSRVRQLEAQVAQLIAAQSPPSVPPRAPQGPSLPA